MLVKWTEQRVRIVPYIGDNKQVMGQVTLLPGVNDIEDSIWNKARGLVKDLIDRGLIIELHTQEKEQKVEEEVEVEKELTDPESKKKVKAKVKEKKSKTVKVVSGKELSKIPIQDAEKLVSETFNMETLLKWKKTEGRDSVRAVIREQIEKIEKSDLSEIIKMAMSSLPEEQRVVIVMKEYQGLKFTEIAEILNCSINTIKSRMYYGLKNMKEILLKSKIDKEEILYEM